MVNVLTRELAERIRAGVVRIRCRGSLGTGFFVAPDRIVTCKHVIESASAEELEVECLSGPVIINYITTPFDPALDLALLEVEAVDGYTLHARAAQKFGTVYSVGFQFSDRGYDGYPAYGMLIGLTREAASGRDLLQIDDAVISEGLSGAPLYSLEDDAVVGVVRRDRPEGGGYAVPIEQLHELEPMLLDRNAAAMHALRRLAPIGTYFQQLAAEHEHFVMGDAHRQLPLDDIYTTLTITQESAAAKLAIRPDGQIIRKAEPAPIRAARFDRGARTGSSASLLGTVSVIDLLSFPKIVVTGEPGSGKTTLLRHIVRRVCKGELAHDQLPIFIRLSLLVPSVGCIEAHIRASYPTAAAALIEATTAGTALLLLDGLDEAPRRQLSLVLAEIDRLSAAGNQVILSCRTVALPRAQISSSFTIMECLGFSPMQQRRFLRQWFGDRHDQAVSLEQQIARNRGVIGFARNPFLLSLMAMVTENEDGFRLPSNRPDLYAQAIRVLFERRAEMNRSKLSARRKISLLKNIAHDYFIRGREDFQEEDLLNRIEQKVLQEKWDVDHEKVLDDILQIDGILVPHRRGRYRFLHLTFQEFLTAKELASRDDVGEVLLAHTCVPRWEEVFRLTCGLLEPAIAEAQVRRLLAAWDTGQTIDDLLLATRAATDCHQLSDKLCAELGERIINAVRNDGAPGREVEAEQVLGDLCRAHRGLTDGVVYRAHKEGHLDTLRLLRILAFAADPVACSILDSMWHYVHQSQIEEGDELSSLAGTIIEATGRAGLLQHAQNLIQLLKADKSYLATAASLALMELQPLTYIREIENIIEDGAGLAECLALSVLLNFQIPELTTRLFNKLFPNGAAALQSIFVHAFNRGEVEFSADTLLRVLSMADGAVAARLLSLERCFAQPALQARALAIFLSDAPPVVVVSATATLVRVNPSLIPKLTVSALEHMRSGAPERIETLLASATMTGAEVLGRLLTENCVVAEMRPLLHSILAFAGANRVSTLREWMVAILEDDRSPDSLWWRAFANLATLKDERVLNYGRMILEIGGRANADPEKLVYRALGDLKSEAARHYLFERFAVESDPSVVAELLTALGKDPNTEVLDVLLQLLDPAAWPQSWPPPESPRRQGDQRPSDHRSFAIVAGLERCGDARCALALSAFADDRRQPYHLREIAGVAARNIELSMIGKNLSE